MLLENHKALADDRLNPNTEFELNQDSNPRAVYGFN